MKFNRFSHIENAYRQKTIEHIVASGLSEGEWAVTEKVHGANFQFSYDGKRLAIGSRNSWKGTDFYYCGKVVDKYSANVVEMYNILRTQYPKAAGNFKQLTIYGELYGGKYPHPEVESCPGEITVQSGIWYSPLQDFYAFDICIDGKFLPVALSNSLFSRCRIPFAATLFVGSFSECLEYPNEFQTTIPGLLELPEIENNICEGVVIRPVIPKFFHSGERVILKNKNDAWSEKQRNNIRQKKRLPSVNKMSDGARAYLTHCLTYITENRLRNVLSHIGPITVKDFGLVLKEFSLDVQEDARKEYMCNISDMVQIECDEKENKVVRKIINTECATMIKKNLLNIVDGRF